MFTKLLSKESIRRISRCGHYLQEDKVRFVQKNMYRLRDNFRGLLCYLTRQKFAARVCTM